MWAAFHPSLGINDAAAETEHRYDMFNAIQWFPRRVFFTLTDGLVCVRRFACNGVAMDTRNMPRLGDLTKLQVNDVFSLEYAKWLSCLGETTIASSASELYLMRYPDGLGASIVKKAIVPPGRTDDPAWAGAMVSPKPFVDAFVAIARSASLLGRIPGLKTIPFGVKEPIQTGDAGYGWVAQGAPKPVSKLAFSDGVTLQPTKCVGIVVLSRELIKLAVPGAEQSLRDTLIAGLTVLPIRVFWIPRRRRTTRPIRKHSWPPFSQADRRRRRPY